MYVCRRDIFILFHPYWYLQSCGNPRLEKLTFLSEMCLLNNFVEIMIKRRKQHIQIIFTKSFYFPAQQRSLTAKEEGGERKRPLPASVAFCITHALAFP